MAAGPARGTAEPRVSEFLLRLVMRGVTDADSARALAAEAGLEESALEDLVTDGALADDEGLLYVTQAGDHRLTEALHARLAPGEESAVAAFAEEFGVLDLQVKSAVTAWQRAVRDSDQEGQVTAVERWLDADSRLHEAAGRWSAAARVFEGCIARLESARQRVLDGEPDQISGPQDTSYHSVWFLLHEMLLRTLKRERGE